MHFRCCRNQPCSSSSSYQPLHAHLASFAKARTTANTAGTAPAGGSIPSLTFLFLPAVCHLSQRLVTLWCQQLSCSADVSWVLRDLIRSCMGALTRSFRSSVSNPLSTRAFFPLPLPPTRHASRGPSRVWALLLCFLISKYKSQAKINLFSLVCYICTSLFSHVKTALGLFICIQETLLCQCTFLAM